MLALKFRMALILFGVSALAAVAFGFLGRSAFATVEFSFPVTDDNVSMIYRCHELETPTKTEENARAAHGFFAPLLFESGRLQGELMARSMSPTRPSSEIIPEIEQIIASADARRKGLKQEMQSRFGCRYRGSV